MLDATHIHPFLVHFPIALVIIGFIFEIISLIKPKNEVNSKMSYYLLVIASITAVLAQLSGLFLTNHPRGGELYEVFEQHEQFALISVALIAITTNLGTIIYMKNLVNSKYRYFFSILYLLSTISIVYTGFLGGTMVYDYMIGL